MAWCLLRLFESQKWPSTSTQNGAARAVRRVFRWAMEMGYIDQNPIATLKAAPKAKREVVISPEEYERILSATPGVRFRELLAFVWNTGCRPQEVTRIQCSHIDTAGRRIIFEIVNSKGNKVARVIFLNDAAFEIVQSNLQKWKNEPLLRTERGRPWNKNIIVNRFKRMKKHLGKQYCLYNFRHSFTTEALKRGVDPVTLAGLLGHSDASTLATVYQHVAADPQYMTNQAERVRK